VALRSGFGLVGVAAAAGITTVVGYTIRWIVAGRLVPMLQVSRCHVSSSQVRQIGVFGLWNFLISITDYVYLHFLPLLIGIVMPVAAVGYYVLAAAK